jgi:hypothetical protein
VRPDREALLFASLSLSLSGSIRVAALKARFQVSSIPTLIVLNSKGEVVSRNGRADVLQSGPAAFDKWYERQALPPHVLITSCCPCALSLSLSPFL